MGTAPNEPDEPLAGLKGFLLWVLVVATSLFAYAIAYLAFDAVFGETPGLIAGVSALILAAAAWAQWGPELPDIPD